MMDTPLHFRTLPLACWRLLDMFILMAPYPFLATTTVLPSPAFSDSTAMAGTVSRMRSMDGTLYTYVSSRQGRRVFNWTFEISRHKALELQQFFDSYFSHAIKIVDHDGQTIIGFFKNNPFEFSGAGRAGPDWPGFEVMNVTFEFEEK